ncbi:N-acetylglucosamine-1-phosphotransferase subunits alpha/beta [Frankliniella fusca]|uniref:N-acetylglucosamine-1-phosphotransferase subunits alpha/beta n=1 Tax=Frankliniella fusca TaxID=407009 RepID=A0AAE1LLQ3_9NEOP|nr:N-acetylglucosamine-1-phosphotransferase subunits alpha/beta [Frankliniella fusca]
MKKGEKRTEKGKKPEEETRPPPMKCVRIPGRALDPGLPAPAVTAAVHRAARPGPRRRLIQEAGGAMEWFCT